MSSASEGVGFPGGFALLWSFSVRFSSPIITRNWRTNELLSQRHPYTKYMPMCLSMVFL
jgi:hypothetical protein